MCRRIQICSHGHWNVDEDVVTYNMLHKDLGTETAKIRDVCVDVDRYAVMDTGT